MPAFGDDDGGGNDGDRDASASLLIAGEALSASLGGAVSAALLYPLEVVKTQMQAGAGEAAAAGAASEGEPEEGDGAGEGASGGGGMIEHARRLYRRDPAVFVRGAEISAFQSALEKALYFLAYEALKRSYLTVTGQKHLSTLPNLALGCAAEWAHLPLTLPVDAWTTRIQTASAGNSKQQAPLAVLLHMLGDPGCRFYSGVSAYALLCLKPALQYTVYEQVRSAVLRSRRGGGSGSSLSAAEAFLLGMVARTVSTVLVFPFLRAKVLLQASRKTSGRAKQPEGAEEPGVAANGEAKGSDEAEPPPPEEQRVMQVVWNMWMQNGVGGLYQGLGPELARGVLSSALMLAIKERVAVAARGLLLRACRARRRKKQPLPPT
jgi:hypothetical protein